MKSHCVEKLQKFKYMQSITWWWSLSLKRISNAIVCMESAQGYGTDLTMNSKKRTLKHSVVPVAIDCSWHIDGSWHMGTSIYKRLECFQIFLLLQMRAFNLAKTLQRKALNSN